MEIYSQTNISLTPVKQNTTYLVGANLLANLDKILKDQKKEYRTFLILADSVPFNLFGNSIISSLQKLKSSIIISQIISSESNKDMGKVKEIVKPYFRQGFTRNACLIAIGGGVATDLGGFIASILLRGIDSIYIPTTLLSQIDAAIGGKTGVNFRDGDVIYKNMLGTFNQPKMVISDVKTLLTLPEKEIKNGLGEMVKYWVGWGKPTPRHLEWCAHALLRGGDNKKEAEELAKIISLCHKIKIEAVKQDPFETKGIRQKLNLGHTIGHAVEGAANGKLSHGQAVSIGLAAAAKISFFKKMLPYNSYELIITSIRKLGLPTSVSSIDVNAVRKALKLDKKGGFFVLIEDIGKLKSVVNVEEKIINNVLRQIIN